MHSVGAIIDKTLKERYVEDWNSISGPSRTTDKVVYAEDSDRMKASYSYYVFDLQEYIAALGAANVGGNVKLEITNVASKIDEVDKQLPQPDGGFQKTFYMCKIVAVNAAEGGDEIEE